MDRKRIGLRIFLVIATVGLRSKLYREPLARPARAIEAALPEGRALRDFFELPEVVRPTKRVRNERSKEKIRNRIYTLTVGAAFRAERRQFRR
jgi:hypothetical protein